MSSLRCRLCGGVGWTLVRVKGTDYAEPCSECKPRHHTAYEQGLWRDSKSINAWFEANPPQHKPKVAATKARDA